MDRLIKNGGARSKERALFRRARPGRCRHFAAGLIATGFATIIAGAPALAAQTESSKSQAASDAAAGPSPATTRHPREMTYLKRQWGIEVLFVRQSAGGYMLEFRYKVIDPEKAIPLFERQTKPVLTHVKTGAKLIVPTPAKTGALRNSNLPQADHTYWMFFANPGKLVDKGDTVNIEIGKFLVEGLVVE